MYLIVTIGNICFAVPVEFIKKVSGLENAKIEGNCVILSDESYSIIDLQKLLRIKNISGFEDLKYEFCVVLSLQDFEDVAFFSTEFLGFVNKEDVNLIRKPSFMNNYGYSAISSFFRYMNRLCYVLNISFLDKDLA